jgi:hypothetical protein
VAEPFDRNSPEAQQRLARQRPLMTQYALAMVVIELLKSQGFDKEKFSAMSRQIIAREYPDGPGADPIGSGHYALEEALGQIERKL